MGLSAIFHHAARLLRDAGQLRIATLQEDLANDRGYSRTWLRPRQFALSSARTVRKLIDELFSTEENAARQAVLGAELLFRLARGAPYDAASRQLRETSAHPIFVEYFLCAPDLPLAENYAKLLAALVERHREVSANKNRQPWCELIGDKLTRDDIQPMILGMHAMRFPQLYSLCADLRLKRSDLAHVD